MRGSTVPEEWRVLADIVPGLLAYFGADGRLVLTNRHCREWLGRDEDCLRGLSMAEALGEGGYSLLARHAEKAAAGLGCVFEGDFPTPAGPRAARVAFLPHLDPPNRPKGYAALLMDLLDRDGPKGPAPRAGGASPAMGALARELGEILSGIGGDADACLGMADARHPLAAKLREMRLAAERGTGLTRRLAALAAPPADGPAAPSRAGDGAKPVILLAEDETSVRRLVARVLQEAGFKVIEAVCGNDALAKAQAHPGPIDLLLTDVVMTPMGGRELAERLLLLRPALPVLYMSGYTDDAVLRFGLQAEGIAFLPKPFAPAALLRKVREVLAGSGIPR